jgi:hypothetical protein
MPSRWYTQAFLGVALLKLQLVVAFLSLMQSLIGIILLRVWASLVTNRTVLWELVNVYLWSAAVLWFLWVWVLAAVFVAFGDVAVPSSYGSSVDALYVSTVLCALPLVAATPLLLLNVSLFLQHVVQGQTITEPESDHDIYDLSESTTWDAASVFCVMIPVLIGILLGELHQLLCTKIADDEEESNELPKPTIVDQATELLTGTFKRIQHCLIRCGSVMPLQL